MSLFTHFQLAAMTRIVPIDPATVTGETAAHVATVRKMLGGTPNLFMTAAHSPAALGAMVSLFASTGRASLGAKVGEQIAVAVARSNRCGYCLSAHTAIGMRYGLDASTLAAAGRAQSSDPRTAALLTLAVAINQSRGHVGDASLDAARDAGITDAEIVEVVAYVALNVFTNYLNSVAQTAIDFPEVSLDDVAEPALQLHATA
jgi:uncharacterized peroxidase-related enzyme